MLLYNQKKAGCEVGFCVLECPLITPRGHWCADGCVHNAPWKREGCVTRPPYQRHGKGVGRFRFGDIQFKFKYKSSNSIQIMTIFVEDLRRSAMQEQALIALTCGIFVKDFPHQANHQKRSVHATPGFALLHINTKTESGEEPGPDMTNPKQYEAFFTVCTVCGRSSVAVGNSLCRTCCRGRHKL